MTPNDIQDTVPGRMIHYVLENMAHRPGIIISVHPPEISREDYPFINLIAFCDLTQDNRSGIFEWCEHCEYSDIPIPGTWHWIERVSVINDANIDVDANIGNDE